MNSASDHNCISNRSERAQPARLWAGMALAALLHERKGDPGLPTVLTRAQQAGAFPNPEAIVGAQQLPLDSKASNQKEYLAGVAQPIPLSGRLGKAREAELLGREVRARGLEVTHRNLRKRVQGAFATALYQEKAFQTQSQIAQNAEQAVATTKARSKAARVSPWRCRPTTRPSRRATSSTCSTPAASSR